VEHPNVGILSNLRRDGKYIGSPDAGQDWHTDMSYRDVMGFVNVLYGIRIPRRNGKPLGGTEFANMHAVYDALPEDVRTRLDGMTATHDFEKFWENMRQNHGSTRPALTEEQRKRRLPVVHPVFLTHPITGRKVLYANPGYTIRINELPRDESDAMLEFLFEFQLRPQFRWTHDWTENDLLIWDHLGTIHRAIADYGPDEIRLVRRCQVMATKVFDPAFLRPVRELAMAEAN
jgi:taurine dioxygenase